MKDRKSKIFLLILCFAISLGMIGCRAAGTSEPPLDSDPFLNPDKNQGGNPQSSNIIIEAGVISPVEKAMTLEYNGSPVTLEYQFKSSGTCTMGLMIFVDGFLQPYQVIGSAQETTMHTVDLEMDDPKSFQLEFIPVCGNVGETLTVVFANVYQAKVLELSGDVNTFGNYQKISQPHPWHLEVNAGLDTKSKNISSLYQTKPFTPEEIQSFERSGSDGQIRSILDDRIYLDICKNDEVLREKIVIRQDDVFEIRAYGNLTGKYRISLYGDFQQIPINGYEYIEVDVKKDEYVSIPLTICLEDIVPYKNMFAVIAPVAAVSESNTYTELSKSDSLYLIYNE